MKSAKAAGLEPDAATGHWPSRVPNGENEGLLLKMENHKTFDLMMRGEQEAGYRVFRRKSNGRLYSFPSGEKPREGFEPYKP